MIRHCIYMLLIFLFLGCKNQNESIIKDFSKEIEQLKTDEQKRLFLESISEADQAIRKKSREAALKDNNKDSVKAEMHTKMKEVDDENLQKIELYLKRYDHPTIDKHGDKACGAPWIVIHHSRTVKARERNFKYLYKAYSNGDLKPSSFSMYLNRYHSHKFGKRFTLPNPYREEDMIKALIEQLGLDVKSK